MADVTVGYFSVHQSDSLWKETVSVAAGFSKQWFAASALRQLFKRFISSMCGISRGVFCPKSTVISTVLIGFSSRLL